MKYQAVISDFYGTLVSPYFPTQYQPVIFKMADTIAAPREAFMKMWLHDTLIQRTTGLLPTDETAVSYICQALDIHASANQIASAANFWFIFERQLNSPLPDAIAVLTLIKENGYKTGLITNCGPNLPAFWPDTPFAPLVDVSVFSSIVGIRKPDERIYSLAYEQLAVQPEQCLYIGDGGNEELSGAANVGMHPVLIRRLSEVDKYKLVERGEWRGPTLTSLKEIPAILAGKILES